MTMKFNPNNVVVKQCISGTIFEETGNTEDAYTAFQQAWEIANNDFERFIAAYHFGRQQKDVKDKLKWMEISLQCALNIDDDDVKSAYSTLYSAIADCYSALSDSENAKKNQALARSYEGQPSDNGPFYHGTKADLEVGDLLTAGGNSNYKSDLKMNHIYFTANPDGAGLAAFLAKGEEPERVYIIEPTGEFEHDPNVTDKKFPGNLTRSYRSEAPLKIIGEATDWNKLTTNERNEWHDKLSKNKGDIIN